MNPKDKTAEAKSKSVGYNIGGKFVSLNSILTEHAKNQPKIEFKKKKVTKTKKVRTKRTQKEK